MREIAKDVQEMNEGEDWSEKKPFERRIVN